MIVSGLRGQLMLHEDTDTAPVAASSSATSAIGIPHPGKGPDLTQILADTVSAAKNDLRAQKEPGEPAHAREQAAAGEQAAGEPAAAALDPGEPVYVILIRIIIFYFLFLYDYLSSSIIMYYYVLLCIAICRREIEQRLLSSFLFCQFASAGFWFWSRYPSFSSSA